MQQASSLTVLSARLMIVSLETPLCDAITKHVEALLEGATADASWS